MPELDKPKLPISLALIAGLAGFGTLGALAYKSKLSLLAALLLTTIWGAIVAIVSKLWDRLEKTLVEMIGDALDIHIRELFSRYQTQYCEHLIFRHRAFDVKGLSTQGVYTLELEQVYVELTINPGVLTSDSGTPVTSLAQSGQRDMLTYLLSPQLLNHNFVVIGAPGSGKTTLLKHIAMGLAARRGAFRKFNKIPILLFIRDHATAIVEKPTVTLAEIATDASQRMGVPAPGGWFQRRLERGRCLVLLDGLDEVADAASRQKVANWVETQMQACGRNRFLISSRRFGYLSYPLSGITLLTVIPFKWDQVERFVRNWYLTNEVMSAQKNDEGVRIAAREGSADLLNRLRNTPALTDLAVNPLLLTMITTIHRYRSSLPGRRVELYSEVCDVFLGRREQARGIQLDLTPLQKMSVLQPLAYHMMCAQKRELPLDEASGVIQDSLSLVSQDTSVAGFLKAIENSSGLLLERENGIYAFAHLTFQEYLAAKHIQEEKIESSFINYVDAPWWHETIRLYAAISDASKIVEACISGDNPSVPALTLAVECLEEARLIQPHLRGAVNRLVRDGVEHQDQERRYLAAETMLALRLRHLTRLDDDHYIDDSLITSAEYQLFIDENRAKSRFYQPDHWSSLMFPPGSGQEAITGVRPSDAVAFCKWLSSREAGDWNYRIPGHDLGHCGSGQVGYWVLINGRAEIKGLSKSLDLTKQFTTFQERLKLDNVALDLDLDLDLASARDLDLDLASARGLDLDLDRDLDLDLALAIDLARARDLDRDLARARALALALASARGLALILDGALARDRDLDLILDGALARDRDLDLDRATINAISRTVFLANLSILEFSRSSDVSAWLGTFRRKMKPNADLRSRLIEVYTKLAILEDRIEGNLPAFEGIRITKIRRSPTKT